MGEAVRFLGIRFRSREHCVWSQITSVLFLFMLTLSGVLILNHWRLPNPQQQLRWLVKCLGWIGFAYFCLSFVAVIRTRGGRRISGQFSPDCVWFNGLVSVMYQVLRQILSCFV